VNQTFLLDPGSLAALGNLSVQANLNAPLVQAVHLANQTVL